MKRFFALVLGGIAASALSPVDAPAIVVDWIVIGHAGNAPDTTGFGAVDHAYKISRTEITQAQYAEFLNAVAADDPGSLYHVNMGNTAWPQVGGIVRNGSPGNYSYVVLPGREHKPIHWVSFWGALRFANWMHNGQPTGAQNSATTEDGAYTITPEGIAANSIVRNADARVFLTNEDEWYKAAYFDGTDYFEYPAGADEPTACTVPGSAANTANCGFPLVVDDLTDVGAYTGSASPYGTFDQGGNVFEWVETSQGTNRWMRGGSWLHNMLPHYMGAAFRYYYYPSFSYSDLGFRIGSIPTEECSDGQDNDGDGLVDFPADPGCGKPLGRTESPQCQDGLDNDAATGTDFDGGESVLGAGNGDPNGADLQCIGAPWRNNEHPTASCGLGTEVAAMLLPLLYLRQRRKSS